MERPGQQGIVVEVCQFPVGLTDLLLVSAIDDRGPNEGVAENGLFTDGGVELIGASLPG